MVGRLREILPDFDQRARQSAPGRMLVHAVADQRAVIGLVVAHFEIFGAQRLDQGPGEARILVPQHADLPRPRAALETGREGMNPEKRGDQTARLRRVDQPGAGAPVGAPVGLDPPRDFVRADAGVAGNDGAVGNAHDQRRIVLAAIGIDQQAGEQGERRRGAGHRREPPRDRLGADVIGDVAGQQFALQAEVAIGRRQGVAGVVAEQDQALVGSAGDEFIGPESLGGGRGLVVGANLQSAPQFSASETNLI